MSEYTNYIDIIFKTFLAILYSGLIGMERQIKHRPAGFRTHIMVCLGAMSIMILSETMFQKYFTQYGIMSDPTRMAAQVISGIGFLGAGTIINYGSNVKGLTTAATLWLMAAIGLIIGAGLYFLATVITITVFTILFLFSKIQHRSNEKRNILDLQIKLINKPKTIGRVTFLLRKMNIKILDQEFTEISDEENLSTDEKFILFHIIIQLPSSSKPEEIVSSLDQIQGVLNIISL